MSELMPFAVMREVGARYGYLLRKKHIGPGLTLLEQVEYRRLSSAFWTAFWQRHSPKNYR